MMNQLNSQAHRVSTKRLAACDVCACVRTRAVLCAVCARAAAGTGTTPAPIGRVAGISSVSSVLLAAP
eukprot:4699127-Pyramimonas_sp.AAC.1